MIHILSQDQLSFFDTYGYVLLPPSSELLPLIEKGLDDICRLASCLIPDFSLSDPNSVLRANQLGLYKFVRQLLINSSIASSSYIHSVASALGNNFPVLGPSNLRLDIAEEPSHLFNWHQDAPSLLGSLRMFTYWIPFTSVSPLTGSIELIPGSHKHGILGDISPRDNLISSATISQNLIINNLPSLYSSNSIIIEAEPASVLILHPLLVHQSHYPSSSHSCRVTSILRLDDLSDKQHLALGGLTSIQSANITTNPEYLSYYSSQ